MNELFAGPAGDKLRRAVLYTVVILAIFLAVQGLQTLLSLRFVGSGITPTKTITVSGEGNVYAIPDRAEFSFSVVSDKTTVTDAQADATQKINALTKYLTNAGVDPKDIQTTNYSIQPQYDYQSAVCPANSAAGTTVYCPPGRQVLKGYEVRQSTDVKVRDLTKAGDLLTGVGSQGATELSGLSLTLEDPTAVQEQARSKAIADAKTKAGRLAGELGVSLGAVVSFTESGGGQPIPLYGFEGGATSKSIAPMAPDISTGQNKITSNVSVTYEIR